VAQPAPGGSATDGDSGDHGGSGGTAPRPTDDDGRAADPTVTSATGGSGRAIGGMRYDVSQFGYQENEYLFAGTAKTFPPSELPPAPYRSRMIVWTPSDPARFNGTTVVEWAQVSDFGQFELTVELNYQAPMLEAQGYAFVLVSAEEGGVCDSTPNGCTPTSLEGADPDRYGTLEHPGDPYSYDIFNQALQALKRPTGLAPLGPLTTRSVIAEGFQASIDKWYPVGAPDPARFSGRPFGIYGALNAYLASGADADARLADGFLIDGGAPADPPIYRVPTLHHLDESAIRRVPTPDGPNHVTWEVVGAAHTDRWATDHFKYPTTNWPPRLARAEEEARRDQYDGFAPDAGGATCKPGRDTGTAYPRRLTLDAALVALDRWIANGTPAPSAARIQRVDAPPDAPTDKLARDADGNAIGGLRSPIIDVPIGVYDGEGCVETGTMAPLPPERLAQLHPTHRSYVERFTAATNTAVDDRFLTCDDAEVLVRKASTSTVGGTDAFSATPRCARRGRP